MYRVWNVVQCAWLGAHQVTLDNKSGSHNTPLHPDSPAYFGFNEQDAYYVWTMLCFGWCSSPFMYHCLSDAVSQFIRSLDVSILTWLDDYGLANHQSSRLEPAADTSMSLKKYTSMSAAASPVSLYTYHMYKQSPSTKTAFHNSKNPRHSQQSTTLRDGIIVRRQGMHERNIAVRRCTPRPIHVRSNRCFPHRLERRYPRAPCSVEVFRMGAIPHQRKGTIHVVQSVMPASGLPLEHPTS